MSKKPQRMPTFREVYENTVRALRFKKADGASAADFRESVDTAIAQRWTCAPSTLLAFKNGRRRPTLDSNPQYFEDLQKYGCAEFDEKGKVIPGTLHQGPDPLVWFHAQPKGSDRRVSERAAQT